MWRAPSILPASHSYGRRTLDDQLRLAGLDRGHGDLRLDLGSRWRCPRPLRQLRVWPYSLQAESPPCLTKGDLQMPEAVIVDTIRTPIGRAFKGSLAGERPDEMGAFVIDQLLERNPAVDPESVEEVYAGCGLPQGVQAFNIARIMVLLSETCRCRSTATRCRAIARRASRRSGSRATRSRPARATLHRLRRRVGQQVQRAPGGGGRGRPERAPTGQRRRPDAYIQMGDTAVNVAKKFGVKREDMDHYAQRSQELAVASQESGNFDRASSRRNSRTATRWTRTTVPGRAQAYEKLSELPEAFEGGGGSRPERLPAERRRGGGARDRPEKGEGAGARATGPDHHRGDSALEPEIMGVAPIGAVHNVLQRAGMTMADVGRVELTRPSRHR